MIKRVFGLRRASREPRVLSGVLQGNTEGRSRRRSTGLLVSGAFMAMFLWLRSRHQREWTSPLDYAPVAPPPAAPAPATASSPPTAAGPDDAPPEAATETGVAGEAGDR